MADCPCHEESEQEIFDAQAEIRALKEELAELRKHVRAPIRRQA